MVGRNRSPEARMVGHSRQTMNQKSLRSDKTNIPNGRDRCRRETHLRHRGTVSNQQDNGSHLSFAALEEIIKGSEERIQHMETIASNRFSPML